MKTHYRCIPVFNGYYEFRVQRRVPWWNPEFELGRWRYVGTIKSRGEFEEFVRAYETRLQSEKTHMAQGILYITAEWRSFTSRPVPPSISETHELVTTKG